MSSNLKCNTIVHIRIDVIRVLNKINSYNATYDEKQSLIAELINEDYLNETRFAKSFSQ